MCKIGCEGGEDVAGGTREIEEERTERRRERNEELFSGLAGFMRKERDSAGIEVDSIPP